MLIAGLLHDTVEDTQTTFEEIVASFGERVARIVMECTDDKSLEKSERKYLQVVNAPHKSPEAKCVKLADKSCNLASILADPPAAWSLERQQEYFAWAERVIRGLLGVNTGLDSHVNELLARGRAKFGAMERAVEQSPILTRDRSRY